MLETAVQVSVPSRIALVSLVLILLSVACLSAAQEVRDQADWPMWRHDAGRSAATPHPLPETLHLRWVRQMPEPTPAWPEEQYKLRFDRSYEPVVKGKRIFVPSMVSDKVTAYDTDTGLEIWRFYCDGPVRFAPVAWRDKIFFVSDDGHLYCLKAEDGRLTWKIRLAPSDARVLGNGRLISSWPARGAPVILDDTVYCAAGIWPFMGIFIYAIDAETGQTIWENSGSGSVYISQQHNSPAFGGVAPQGYLAASDDMLLLPSRTTPACYNRHTGELTYYHLSDRNMGKHVGGYNVYLWKDLFFNNHIAYRLRDGKGLVRTNVQITPEETIVALEENGDVLAYVPEEVNPADRKKNEPEIRARALWQARFDLAIDKIHIQAGRQLYGSDSQGILVAIDPGTPGKKDNKPTISWTHRIKGKVWTMLAGDDKLFVVTEDGRLYCFSGEEMAATWHEEGDTPLPPVARENRRTARRILNQVDTKEGYCVLLGPDHGDLARSLLEQSDFHVIAVENDANVVNAIRRQMDDMGLYGRRISILNGPINATSLPPYMANLIVAENLAIQSHDLETVIERLYDVLRPYGGTAWLDIAGTGPRVAARQLADLRLAGSAIETKGPATVLRRRGPLPGSGDWVGQYGDAANTVVSKDQLKPPLGLLWFGDNSQFTDVLPRHGHGPPEQVIGGRLFIEGVDSISARDVYTGRILWKKGLRNPNTFGIYYDASYKSDHRDLSYNQLHIPGANTRGTNFVATQDKVYVIDGAKCLVLDATTGEQAKVFALPPRDGKAPASWAYLSVCDNYLLAGADFVTFLDGRTGNDRKLENFARYFDKYASQRLVVMNRHTGQVLWTIDAEVGFIHNGIAAGNGRLFCIDGLPPSLAGVLRTRDDMTGPPGRLLSLNLRDGSVAWQKRQDVFGSWIGYSEEHDILLQAHRKSRDMVPEPGDRMATYQGTTGLTLWDKAIAYSGPCMLHGDSIITQEAAYDLHTGQPLMRKHPLTDEPIAWEYARNYGCNTVIASANLLTFRSAAAGFFDLANDGGTGNLGGFKSGCTSNLVVANGVLNAPEYTRTCTCSYQNQTSLALIHRPEVEMWTFNPIEAPSKPIRRVGINFGAPGDRKAADGTLWLDYPSVGGPSPAVEITVAPATPTWFRAHSCRIQKGDLKWVEASGAKGMAEVTINLRPSASAPDPNAAPPAVSEPRPYTVRLHFAEPDYINEGRRVFDVTIQGQTVLNDFDIIREAGGPHIGLVRTFAGILASDSMKIGLRSEVQDAETVLCGIELIAE